MKLPEAQLSYRVTLKKPIFEEISDIAYDRIVRVIAAQSFDPMYYHTIGNICYCFSLPSRDLFALQVGCFKKERNPATRGIFG